MSDKKDIKFWAQKAAEETIARFPNAELYTCAAGISPSGEVHFGNFRDIATALAVSEELERLGKKTRILFSWDEFDRFRKVPAGVDILFEEHIGKPLTIVPDPYDCNHESYARHFEVELEKSMQKLGIDLEYRYQYKNYSAGDYVQGITIALQKKQEIAKILLSFMSEKGKQAQNLDQDNYIASYYPISIYSRFTKKDNTEIISYDGKTTVTYRCIDAGKEDTVDFSKEHTFIKLAWKIDWPMRWKHEKVMYEPSGADHTSPQGSFFVASKIAKEIYDIEPPSFIGYNFVGIQGQGSKMSGSKGNAVTPKQLLEIYQPSLLKWLYLRKSPHQTFSLAFNSDIYRQYEEFDRVVISSFQDKLGAIEKRQLEISFKNTEDSVSDKPFPFRQAVALGQMVQWDTQKVKEILYSLDLQFDINSIEQRLPLAKAWLEAYNPSEIIRLRDEPNMEYASTLSLESKKHIDTLKEKLSRDITDIKVLEEMVYAIPKNESFSQKENAILQRAFFKDVYNLLLGIDKGPRLSTFLWAVDRKMVLVLLTI